MRKSHLQHCDFNYVIEIKNTFGTESSGTVRIFIAPQFDLNNVEFTFEEMRLKMIELDRFTTTSELTQKTELLKFIHNKEILF